MRVQHALFRAVIAAFFGQSATRFEEVITHRNSVVIVSPKITVAHVQKHVDGADTAVQALEWLGNTFTDAGHLDDIKTAALMIIAGEFYEP